jgi:predicted unusual protein kinase regulating ubiquinone biosynthesis (AarF/ABC1/UbiB family)
VVTIEGIVRNLYPAVDLIGIARPYAEQVLRQHYYSPQRLLEEAFGGMASFGSLPRELPNQVDQRVHDVETGNFPLQRGPGCARHTAQRARTSSSLAQSSRAPANTRGVGRRMVSGSR